MAKKKNKIIPSTIFDRVVSILEQARGNIVRAVNNQTVTAYWLIGREIVQELQDGAPRAEYGKQLIQELSVKLNEKYGKGFSSTNLGYFRQFYLTYKNRLQIHHPLGGESYCQTISHPTGGKLFESQNSSPAGSELEGKSKIYPTGREYKKSK